MTDRAILAERFRKAAAGWKGSWLQEVDVHVEVGDLQAIADLLEAKGSADAVRHAFRAVDHLDWRHLESFIPDSGHGRFWKAVFAEVQEVLRLPSPKAAGDETSKLYADPRIPPSPDARAAVIEATRLLRKIVDLAYDENVAEPLDDAVSYANKALAALSQAPAADGDKLPPDWKQDQAETSRLAPSHTRPHHHTKAD